ncbi:tol1 [Symbiodinium sp. CCMP2592]|nr:tol1 [Symbiodinium sp. CCMP2592]
MHAQCSAANIVSKRHFRGAVKLIPSSLAYLTDIECDSGDCPSNMADSGSHDLALLRRVVVEVVEKACHLTSKIQKNILHEEVLKKEDFSPVTIADFASQALVGHILHQAFPHIPMVGEEDASALRADPKLATKVSDHVKEFIADISLEEVLGALDRGNHPGGEGTFWVLDPIDGTKGFLRKEQFAVCLCLIENGEVLVAALGCPNLPVDSALPDGEKGCVFIGVKGQGAAQMDISTKKEFPICVSSSSDASKATYVESLESGHSSHGRHAEIASALGMGAPLRMDSQCKFGVVARGQASLYLRISKTPQYIWDIAAGAMIVEEAGGRVTDLTGQPLQFSLGRTVGVAALFASNGLIHDQVLAACAPAEDSSHSCFV